MEPLRKAKIFYHKGHKGFSQRTQNIVKQHIIFVNFVWTLCSLWLKRGCKGLAMTALSFCFALLSLSACQWNTLPPDIWEKEQMTEFLVEAQLVEAKVETKEFSKKQKDSLSACLYEELFACYNTTREIWQKNIEYYRDKPEEMDDIYKEVVLRLTLLESTVQHEQTGRDTLERKLKEFKIRQQD